MKPLIVIRPQPGCDATVAAAQKMGIAARGFPLFAVEPVDWAMPTGLFDALLIGSANVLRHGGPGLDALRHLPVLAVGEATAAAARAAGFDVALTGNGYLQSVIDAAGPGYGRLLRLCGRERVAVRIPDGVEVSEVAVYDSVAQPPSPALAAALAQDCVVMLHSAAAARHLASLNLSRERIAIACISPRTRDAAGTGWHAASVSASPDDAALLALATAMCQDAAGCT